MIQTEQQPAPAPPERSEAERWGRLARGLEGAALVAAVGYVVLFLVVAGLRVGYPYELEWMEGGSLDHVRRVLAGEPLYVVPSLDFVPFIYTPLYFWVAAGASALLGEGFLPLRLVSVLSTVGCFGLLFLWVRRESGSRRAGLLAAGLYAATFEVAGAWLDVARVDALFMVLLLGGFYAARFARAAPGLVGAGLLVGLAFLAKQTALVVALPVGLWTLLAHRGAGRFGFVAAFAVVAGGTSLLLDGGSEGWYGYYVFDLPRHHDLVASVVVSFWSEDVLRPLGLAALATVAFWVGARREQQGFYGLLLLGLVGASYASRLHDGGYLNVLLPACAGLALGFGLGVDRLGRWASAQGPRASAFLGLAVLVQFAVLVYNPALQVPTAADRAAGDRLVAALRGLPGEVLVPSHPYLAVRAGKAPHAQRMALFDVWRGPAAQRERLEAEVHAALGSGRYGAVVLDEPWWGLPEGFEARYEAAGPPFEERGVFWPVTGRPTRPELLYLRRE